MKIFSINVYYEIDGEENEEIIKVEAENEDEAYEKVTEMLPDAEIFEMSLNSEEDF